LLIKVFAEGKKGGGKEGGKEDTKVSALWCLARISLVNIIQAK
jgi:hypothetical protein